MDLKVLPLHQHIKYTQQCCDLINKEWKRSDTARLRSLECSCDNLPTCLILVQNDRVIGHLKLTPIPNRKHTCFIESVVIDDKMRGQGLGTHLMKWAEEHCRNNLNLNEIYLSTRGQEGFYRKLGYIECPPISIYGSFTINSTTSDKTSNNNTSIISDEVFCKSLTPNPPPLPQNLINQNSTKTYMKKPLTVIDN